MLLIRKFSPSDLSKVYEIEAESFKDPYHPFFLINLHELYPDTFLVAELGGRVIGYVIARKAGGRGHIIAIAVEKKYRISGIGRKLIEAVESILLKQVREIWLEVRVSNLEAIEFYRRLGYLEYKLQENYYADGEAALIFKKYMY